MNQVIVIVSQESPGIYVVHDAGGGQHRAKGSELEAVFLRLMADGSLPRTESVDPKRARIEEAAKNVIEQNVPGVFRPFAGPAAKSLIDKMVDLSNRRHARRRVG